MVLPLIAAGIGIVSAVASVKSQNDAANAQRSATNAQILNEQRNAKIAKQVNAYKKAQINSNARVEQAQRRAEFREQDNALKTAALQVASEQRIAQVKADAQIETNRRTLRDAAITLTANEVNRRATNVANKAQLKSRTQSTTQGIEQVDVGGNVTAELAASNMLGGVTSGDLRDNGVDTAYDAVTQSLRAEAAAQAELDAYDNYVQNDDLSNSLRNALTIGTATFDNAEATKRINAALSINNALSENSQANIATQRRQLRINRNITNNNAQASKRISLAEIAGNNDLTSAQSAATQSQLYSQRASGVNWASALGTVSQQALPLVSSLVQSAKVNVPSQSSGYGTTSALGYELYGVNSNEGYNFGGASTSGNFGRYSVSR